MTVRERSGRGIRVSAAALGIFVLLEVISAGVLCIVLGWSWQDALEALTGSRQMDATAIIDYFAPLKQWLDEQTKGQPIGW